MKNPRIIALLPMRHDSERVAGKNYRSFAGRPLFHHIVETLLRCSSIAEVVIDTDSPAIMADAASSFPQVTLLERPQRLRDGAVAMNEVLLHTTAQVEGDFYLQTHSTNPLLRAETVTLAIDRMLAEYPAFDSLFSVTRMQTRLWDAMTRPVNHNPAILARTQDLPAVYEENSCLFMFTRQSLAARRNRIGERPLMFEIDRLESVDIDEELDFQIAEFLFRQHRVSGGVR